MDIILVLKAILLGIVEGLTEFIPVSSTGHLIIAGKFLKFENGDGHLFEIAIQLGAILAICFLYREKLLEVGTTFYKEKKSRDFIYKIFLAFLPSAIVGVFFYKFIKSVLFSPKIVAISLIIGGAIILVVEEYNKKPKLKKVDKVDLKTALKIGLYQVVSIIPGVSRSGATIIGGLLSKLNRKTATEFSFFLSIPTIFGATVYDIYNNIELINGNNLLIILVGFVTSFLSALIVVKWFIKFVSKSSFKIFGYYRILLGILLIILIR